MVIGDAEWALSGQEIGRFTVTIDAASCRDYMQAISPLITDEELESIAPPLTYPIIWLGRPDVKAALEETLSDNPLVKTHALIHLEQDFTYHQPLQRATDYQLYIRLMGPDADRKCRMEATLQDGEKKQIATMRTSFVFASLEDARS